MILNEQKREFQKSYVKLIKLTEQSKFLFSFGSLICLLCIPLPLQSVFASDAGRFYLRADVGGAYKVSSNAEKSVKGNIFKNLTRKVGIGYDFFSYDKKGKKVSGAYANEASSISWPLRVDLSIERRKLSTESLGSKYYNNAYNRSIFCNLYVDLIDKNHSWINLYYMAGIGYGRNNVESSSSKATKGTITSEISTRDMNNGSLVWNIGVGAIYSLSKSIDLDLSYRYVSLGDIRANFEISAKKEGSDKFLSKNYELGVKRIRTHETTVGIIVKL